MLKPPSVERPYTLNVGPHAEQVLALFARGEAYDSMGFAEQFADTPLYQFGNVAACRSKAEIVASTDSFFAQVQALYHGVRSLTEVDDTVFVEMDVVYWRHDGSYVELPCADIVRFEQGKIAELRIFMDAAPIGVPDQPPAESATVRLRCDGRYEPLSGAMRHFFTITAAGRARVAAGYLPKWSISGPRWPVVTGD